MTLPNVLDIFRGAVRLQHPAYPNAQQSIKMPGEPGNPLPHAAAIMLHWPLPHGDSWLPDLFVSAQTSHYYPDQAPFAFRFPFAVEPVRIYSLDAALVCLCLALRRPGDSYYIHALLCAVRDETSQSCHPDRDFANLVALGARAREQAELFSASTNTNTLRL